MNIDFAVYLVCLIAFVGWWLFILFAGVGMAAWPIDLFMEFKTRPKKLSQNELRKRKKSILRNVKQLKEEAETIAKSEEVTRKKKLNFRERWLFRSNTKLKRDTTKFEARTLITEREFTIWFKSRDASKWLPVIYISKLILGIILAIFTLLWLLHIFLYQLTSFILNRPLTPFFNDILDFFRDNSMEFVSAILFVALSLYMLMCALKGATKFGL
jgi:LMBR1 domain-containing protein 1